MNRLLSGIGEAFRSIRSTAKRSTLPPRALRAINRSDDMSEVLVKLIQFGVFATIGIIYFLSPVPNPNTVSQLPLIISIYLLFTLVVLGFAVVRALPGWLIFLSIAIDVGLLTWLIFSFHIQYEQPASFSLKAPEAMYYFVLIGLRSLRFESRYVVAAGAMSVIGWSALVIYAVTHDFSDPMITRNYITYLTTNSVLIGAEIGKILTLIIFTGILAVAVRRAHTFLVDAIAEGYAANDLARFMPNAVATRIREADHRIVAGEGMRREAAILNVDIRGFTRLVRNMEPAEAMSLLSDYQHRIVPIVHAHNGVIDKFMGDGIMITFGAASADEKHCANALRCADEIIASVKNWKSKIAGATINLAIASGPVIAGAVGDGDRLEYTVIGPAVNASAKLEKVNKALGTTGLCLAHTHQHAVDQGYLARNQPRRESIDLDGELGVVEVVVLG